MNFNVAGLLQDLVGSTREFHVRENVDMADSGITLTSPVDGTVRFTRTSRGVLVEAHLHAVVQQTCSRCLELTASPVDLDLAEEFLQTLDVSTGLPLAATQEDPAILINGHHEINLDDLIRQYLLIELPMHPLCRDDCAGLCPECGHNLNEGPCACPPPITDSRWAALGDLLKTQKPSETS